MVKLTVIIPCYKFEKYIAQCITSIFAQKTTFKFDIVVRDDGSNDGTVEYLKTQNVKLLNSDCNIGAAKNIQVLLQNCNSKYIAYIDGDDYFTDDTYFQRTVDFLESNEQYVMYCSACNYLKLEKSVPEEYNVIPLKDILQTSDLLEENYVTFGRIFRNVLTITPWILTLPYPDWGMNYEISKYGLIKCDMNSYGVYRLTNSGMIAADSRELINKKNKTIKEVLMNNYKQYKFKKINIIDAFVYNEIVQNNLIETISRIKNNNEDVLLVSNTPVNMDIIKSVDFYLYDRRNQLFEREYENVPSVDFWHILGNVKFHNIDRGVQRHGLSVLINLFNSLIYAKTLGFTHFQRFEVDDIYGKESQQFIQSVPNMCFENDKMGMFFFNSHSPLDISFHYFYCEIDFFLRAVKHIKTEQDYIDYIFQFYKTREFKSVEIFIHDYISSFVNDIIKKTSDDMKINFPDTQWNTTTSPSNFSNGTHNSCSTNVYKMKTSNKLLVLSYNNSTIKHTRHINIGELKLCHVMNGLSNWVYDIVKISSDVVDVYEDNMLLYSINPCSILNYAEPIE